MVGMADFMFCVFYHNFRLKKSTSDATNIVAQGRARVLFKLNIPVKQVCG